MKPIWDSVLHTGALAILITAGIFWIYPPALVLFFSVCIACVAALLLVVFCDAISAKEKVKQ